MTTENEQQQPQTIDMAAVATFAKKLASGKKATAEWEVGLAYFSRLPGWRVKRQVLPLPLRGGVMDNNVEKLTRSGFNRQGQKIREPVLPSIITNSQDKFDELNLKSANEYKLKDKGVLVPMDYDWANFDTNILKNSPRVIIGTPTADTVKEGMVYFERFEERQTAPYGRTIEVLFLGQAWYGVQGATITSPSGATVAVFNEPKAPGEFGADSFYTWGKKNGLYEDAKKHLEIFAKPPTPEEEERMRLGGGLDETGYCAICGRRQKMHHITERKPLMYQHGYQIPPWFLRRGEAPRVGVCFGSGYPPIEVSPAALPYYLDVLREQLVQAHSHLAWARGTTRITKMEPGPYDHKKGERTMVEVEYTPSHHEWKRVRDTEIAKTEKLISDLDEDIKTYSRMWREWKRKPTYDEVLAGKDIYITVLPPKAVLDREEVIASIVRG